jgi:phage terminase large subunit-like protein
LALPPATRSSSRRSTSRRKPAPTYGPLAAAWIEANVVHGEGDLFGEPFILTADQRHFLDNLLRFDPKTHRLIVRRAVLGRAKGWGKTEFLAAIALFFLAGPLAPKAPNIPIAAASFEQADLLFGSARTMVTEGPLKPDVEVFDTELLLRNLPGRMYRVAAAAGTNDGSRPTLFVADELHEWTGNKARVFLVVSNSIAKRQDGMVLVISTAGSEDSDLLRGLYDYGRQVQAGKIEDPAFLLDWAEADEKLNPHDGPEVRRIMALQANPHAEAFHLLEHIERRWHEIAEHEWLRYFANRWVTVALESWLPGGEWERHREPGARVDTSQPFVVTVDMALKHDTCSVRATQLRPDGKVVTQAWPFVPDGRSLDVAKIEAQIRTLHATGNCVEVAYDPAFFERSAQALADDGVAMLEFPQSAQRMVPACGTTYEQILAGHVVHDDDPLSADQVKSAVPRDTDSGWRLSKGRSKRKIDAAITLVMGVARVLTRVEEKPIVPLGMWR